MIYILNDKVQNISKSQLQIAKAGHLSNENQTFGSDNNDAFYDNYTYDDDCEYDDDVNDNVINDDDDDDVDDDTDDAY